VIRPWRKLGDLASILRLHIIAIAICAALTFGKILTGRVELVVALLGGLDWLLINLLNRVSDVLEDSTNQVRGTEQLVGHHRLVWGIWLGLLLGSLTLGHLLCPELTLWRLGVQVVGVGYSYRIVPTPGGWRRFKDLYFLKNFMSALLFVATCLLYPLLVAGAFAPGYGWASFVALALFFVPFEITYEILYDLRDLAGDRKANVPTYPVVHGPAIAARLIDLLLVTALVVLLTSVLAGLLGVRESLMAVAPLIQYGYYKPRLRRGLTSGDCIRLTWVGAALLATWLLGTSLWELSGLPVNLWIRAS